MPPRRLIFGALAALPAFARAQDAFPTRAIAMLSGYAPGGVTDITARAVAERMARELVSRSSWRTGSVRRPRSPATR